MDSFDITRLKRIVKNTLNMIDKSREAIYDIAEGARRECSRLEDELKQLKIEVERIIIQGEELEQQLKKSRMKLALISKNFDKYGQDDIRLAYESADKIRIELAVNREREKFTIVRRNDLERRLKEAYGTVKRAEELVNQVGTVMDYLSGDLSNLDIQLEDAEKRKYLAVRIIKAQEEERSRVAREIHDGPAQMMSNVVLKAEICEKLIDVDLEKARAELNNLKKAVRNSLMDVRRIIYTIGICSEQPITNATVTAANDAFLMESLLIKGFLNITCASQAIPKVRIAARINEGSSMSWAIVLISASDKKSVLPVISD
jgi:two-component system sensor histidine kinase DegS